MQLRHRIYENNLPFITVLVNLLLRFFCDMLLAVQQLYVSCLYNSICCQHFLTVPYCALCLMHILLLLLLCL